MKQIVDFEQAKRLYKINIFPKCKLWIECNGITYISPQDVTDEIYPAPTIGELIEWIEDNIQDNSLWMIKTPLKVCQIYDTKGKCIQASCNNELIDALVELAIKIKEDKR